MNAPLATVLVASLLGSLHCVAMCGPLAAMHLAPGSRATLRLGLVYSLGRLVTYATLGVLAGLAGRVLDLAGELAQVQRVAAVVAGAAIVAWGLIAIVRVVRPPSAPRSVTGGGAFTAGLVRLRTRKPTTRAAALGVLTGLLPCGWLWAFVVVAAGTGGALPGALVMTTFWLGTVPAMLGVTTIAAPLINRLRERLPIATALVLVALGVATLAGRWHVAGVAGLGTPSQPACHSTSAS